MFRSIVLIFIFCSYFANASENNLPLYDGAQELSKKQSFVDKHHIALSKNKKIDGRWLFGNEQKLSGDLVQTLYQIETDDTLQNIADFYQAWISRTQPEILFSCIARLCGSSNQWANGFFHQKLLYGPDANQFYWVVKQNDTFWVVYLIERGNKRIYLYAERLQPKDVVSSVKLQVPVNCLIDQKFINNNTVLSQEQTSEYVLIVSIAGSNTLKDSQTKAEECANTLKQAFPLLKINALGLGEFSSSLAQKVKSDQIELMRLESH